MLFALKSTRLGYPVFVVLDARPTKNLSKLGAKETRVCLRIAASVQNQFWCVGKLKGDPINEFL